MADRTPSPSPRTRSPSALPDPSRSSSPARTPASARRRPRARCCPCSWTPGCIPRASSPTRAGASLSPLPPTRSRCARRPGASCRWTCSAPTASARPWLPEWPRAAWARSRTGTSRSPRGSSSGTAPWWWRAPAASSSRSTPSGTSSTSSTRCGCPCCWWRGRGWARSTIRPCRCEALADRAGSPSRPCCSAGARPRVIPSERDNRLLLGRAARTSGARSSSFPPRCTPASRRVPRGAASACPTSRARPINRPPPRSKCYRSCKFSGVVAAKWTRVLICARNRSRMADIIDLTLLADVRRYFQKLLDTRGLPYFLKKEGHAAVPDRALEGRARHPDRAPHAQGRAAPASGAGGGALPHGDPPRADPPRGQRHATNGVVSRFSSRTRSPGR